MFYNDHGAPHFHVVYAEFKATFRIDQLSPESGRLPRRAENLVLEWAALHLGELRENWRRARDSESLQRIEGLV
jgi:hypothetical protein